MTNARTQGIIKIQSAVFGVRRLCGIHSIYSGAVIRGDRQGLHCGKSDASRCGTHLLFAGSPFAEVRHRRIILKIHRFFNKIGKRKGRFPPSFFCTVSRLSLHSAARVAACQIVDFRNADKVIIPFNRML